MIKPTDFIPYLTFWILWFGLSNGFEYIFLKDRQKSLTSKYVTTANQMSNLLHAFVLIILGFYIMLFEFKLDVGLSFWQQELILFSGSFMLVDSAVLLFFRHPKWDILIHHFIILVLFGMIIYLNTAGWILAASAVIGELGPCVYIENIARRWNVDSEEFLKKNDTLYLFSFLLSRLIGLSIIYYIALMKTKTPTAILVFGALFFCLGIYWSYLLIKRYMRRYPSSRIARGLRLIMG